MPEQFYSIEETCRLLNCSPATLWRLRRTGLIGFRRVGNRPKFSASHIEAYQQSRPIGAVEQYGAIKQEDAAFVN